MVEWDEARPVWCARVGEKTGQGVRARWSCVWWRGCVSWCGGGCMCTGRCFRTCLPKGAKRGVFWRLRLLHKQAQNKKFRACSARSRRPYSSVRQRLVSLPPLGTQVHAGKNSPSHRRHMCRKPHTWGTWRTCSVVLGCPTLFSMVTQGRREE